MSETARTRLLRWYFNRFPAYRRTGARITYISGDLHEARIRLPLNRKTRNYVGTIFGGSMYAAIDPIYMVMFIRILGPDYIVWDKSAAIRFVKPGRSTLRATFAIGPAEPELIRRELAKKRTLERTYRVELVDEAGTVCCTAEKVLHFSKRTRNEEDRDAENR